MIMQFIYDRKLTPIIEGQDFMFTIDSGDDNLFEMRLSALPGEELIADLGDGNVYTVSTVGAPISHTYVTSGIYQIKISGNVQQFKIGATDPFFGSDPSSLKIISLDQWGASKWANMENMFLGCRNMVANYTDNPDTSNVVSMKKMFDNCRVFNGPINFNMSKVTTTYDMFRFCYEFNQDFISNDTVQLEDATGMFSNCYNFNSTVSMYTPKLKALYGMFSNCRVLDKTVTLTTALVSNFSEMFSGCSMLTKPANLGTSVYGSNFYQAFYNCTLLKQSFVNINVSEVVVDTLTGPLRYFISGGDINEPGTTTNYDETLISWAGQLPRTTKSSLNTIDFGNSKYSSVAVNSRSIIEGKNWAIRDGGLQV